MRIVFRADATREIGAGHVMRCWALAEEFARRGSSVVWTGDIDIPWVRDRLGCHGWEVVPARGSVQEQAASVVGDLVIVDSYTLDQTYRQLLLERELPVVAIVDDAHSQAGPGSLWVNPGVPMRLADAPVGYFLNGPEYVFIREEIRLLRTHREERLRAGTTPSGVAFLLGGTDHANLAPQINELVGQSRDLGGVVAGPGAQAPLSGVQWFQGGPGLLQRASEASLVVSAAGVSSWEMLHIGVPLALVVTADNQRGNYDWMTTRGLAWPLGPASTFSSGPRLRDALKELLKASKDRLAVGQSVVDGRGAQRVVDRAARLVTRN